MKKKIIRQNQRIHYTDFMDMQDFWQESCDFILRDALGYDDFCTEDNLEPIPLDPASMAIQIRAGRAYKDRELAYLLAPITITIDPAGEEDRVDLITATTTDIETDEQLRGFYECNEGIINTYFQHVDLLHVKVFQIHYLKDTEEVPEGHMGIASIPVNTDTEALGEGAFDDIRPMKSTLDLLAHIMSNPLDHEPGCIFNTHIANNAAISLFKLEGQTFDNFEDDVHFDFPKESEIDITFDVNDLPVEINYESGYYKIDYTINWSDILPSTLQHSYKKNDVELKAFTTTFTWDNSLPTKVVTVEDV